MATYVLVPGAWLGGWVWRDVAARLRSNGHEVYPITLTGLGERVHLARPEIDLETHITDVVNVLRSNDLGEVILAGHSYAGTVITGVADRVPDLIQKIVYVDSAPLADGMALTDLFGPEGTAALQQVVDAQGEGWRLPFPGLTALGEDASPRGLDDAARTLMARQAVAQPWRTYTDPLRLHQTNDPSYEQVAIACDDIRGMVSAGVPPIVALTAPPWRYLELDTGHWPMLSAPADLSDLLHGLATRG